MSRIWFIAPPYTESDLSWVETSGLEYTITSPYPDEGDSGWCDYSTGCQIITDQHKIFVRSNTPAEVTWILLKYDVRATSVQVIVDDSCMG